MMIQQVTIELTETDEGRSLVNSWSAIALLNEKLPVE
jgi:hypothetical protein